MRKQCNYEEDGQNMPPGAGRLQLMTIVIFLAGIGNDLRANLKTMFRKVWIALFMIFTSYSAFVYHSDNIKSIPAPNEHVSSGRALWQKHNCQACHQFYGLGGYMGPDLTNIISIKGEHNAYTYIKWGTGRMPDFRLTDSEVKDLIAFLTWIDQSGQSKIEKQKVHWSGTYVIE